MVLAVVGRLHERPEPDAGAVAQVGQHKRPAVEKRLPESGLAAVADQRGEIALRLRAVVRDARGAQIGAVGNPNRADRKRVVYGKNVWVRVDLGDGRLIKKTRAKPRLSTRNHNNSQKN